MAQFFLRNSPDYRPTLVVQTCKQADEQAIQSFKELLLRQGCPIGLLFDSKECHIVSDTYTSLGIESLRVEKILSTDEVLRKLDRPGTLTPPSLNRRVELWLYQLAAKWENAISDDPKIAQYFYADIISGAAQASISRHDEPEEHAA